MRSRGRFSHSMKVIDQWRRHSIMVILIEAALSINLLFFTLLDQGCSFFVA
ncbi:hypothetical protein Sjap_022761 [Stephania japonica]|uniref:Uncharacterized protein n=1 Tax=Stephania japonica TaxID=461633 RepID=A0AAP0EPY9_9MAGN